MNITIAIFGYLIAAYFFAAAANPRIRIRSGYARSLSWSRSGKTKGRYRQPKMGTLTCLGTGIFIASLATVFVVPDTEVTTVASILFAGFVLAIIGRIVDTGGGSGWKKY